MKNLNMFQTFLPEDKQEGYQKFVLLIEEAKKEGFVFNFQFPVSFERVLELELEELLSSPGYTLAAGMVADFVLSKEAEFLADLSNWEQDKVLSYWSNLVKNAPEWALEPEKIVRIYFANGEFTVSVQERTNSKTEFVAVFSPSGEKFKSLAEAWKTIQPIVSPSSKAVSVSCDSFLAIAKGKEIGNLISKIEYKESGKNGIQKLEFAAPAAKK